MLRRALLCFSCAALCSLSAPSLAQEVGTKVVITYDTLDMNPLLDGPVVDVESDATNRVWAVTPDAASAALGSVRAPLFPIDVTDTSLPVAAQFRSVTFAVPTGNAADGEHFYLGSDNGIAWGRLAATVDHRGALRFNTSAQSPEPEDVVNELASDGSDWLWAATNGGLVLWDLRASAPTLEDVYLDSAGDGPIDHVAAAPWGEAAAVDGERLLLVDALGNATLVRDLGSAAFLGIAFDAIGNLWAVTDSTVGGHPLILKFESDGAPGVAATVLTGVFRELPLNPFVGTGSGAPAGFLPTDIAVDPFTGRVWVTTESSNQGPMNTAYYQDPDASGDLETDPAVNNWGVVTSTFDQHTVVHADASGNAWFGMAGSSASSEALNGYVVRLLTLDKSRYLGDVTGVATLVDLTLAGDGTAPVTLAIGGDSRDFNPSETGADSGTFVQTFHIVPSGTAGGSGSEFQVSSSAADVPVEARYEFTDASDVDRELTATASWANIVKFEDDLWIGSCFLRSLGW